MVKTEEKFETTPARPFGGSGCTCGGAALGVLMGGGESPRAGRLGENGPRFGSKTASFERRMRAQTWISNQFCPAQEPIAIRDVEGARAPLPPVQWGRGIGTRTRDVSWTWWISRIFTSSSLPGG